MADFVEEEETTKEAAAPEGAGAGAGAAAEPLHVNVTVDFANPVAVSYCPHCSMPSEYCQYGPKFKEHCLPYMQGIFSEEELARALGQTSLEGGVKDVGPKKSRIVSKEATVLETKIVIARIQRQKKKFVTSVMGLDTVAQLRGKLEDAAKFFKKKFSCGASVSETPTGQFEVVIQGDVSLELPEKLIQEYKVEPKAIYFADEKGPGMRCYV